MRMFIMSLSFILFFTVNVNANGAENAARKSNVGQIHFSALRYVDILNNADETNLVGVSKMAKECILELNVMFNIPNTNVEFKRAVSDLIDAYENLDNIISEINMNNANQIVSIGKSLFDEDMGGILKNLVASGSKNKYLNEKFVKAYFNIARKIEILGEAQKTVKLKL